VTVKEFEIQKALGLAEEYDLVINAGPSVSVQAIKDAVEKHSFTSKCFEIVYSDIDEPCVPYVTLKFEVGCVHEIVKLIVSEFYPRFAIRILVKRSTND